MSGLAAVHLEQSFNIVAARQTVIGPGYSIATPFYLDASNNRVLARLIQRSRDLREMRDGLTSSAVAMA
jgi:hypothetical protein